MPNSMRKKRSVAKAVKVKWKSTLLTNNFKNDLSISYILLMSDADRRESSFVGGTKVGLSMFNVLSNVAYAGMKAQGSKNTFGRFVTFWGGFPGTLVSYFFV